MSALPISKKDSTIELTIKIPKDCDFVALRFSAEGFWEATAICFGISDRHGNAIPSQLGMGFKARTPQQAFAIACDEARSKLNKILRVRNAKPKPAEEAVVNEVLATMPKAKNKSVAAQQKAELTELLGLVGEIK